MAPCVPCSRERASERLLPSAAHIGGAPCHLDTIPIIANTCLRTGNERPAVPPRAGSQREKSRRDGQVDDDDLMVRIAEGDGAAFRALYERHGATTLNFFNRRVNDRQAAEDLNQELFLRVLRTAPRYRGGGGFARWLYTVALNLCRDYYRRRASAPAIVDEVAEEWWQTIPDAGADPAREVIRRAERHEVWRAIGQLPPGLREIVILREYEHHSYAEIAARVGVEMPTLRTRMHRAIESLRRLLAAQREREYAGDL